MGRLGILEYFSNQPWSGSVLDTGGDSETIDSGNYVINDGIEADKLIECMPGGIYSLSFQKQSDSGYLDVVLVKNGTILDDGSTVADYGIVSLSGKC